MRFRTWLEAPYKHPKKAFGQSINSDEDFDRVSRERWRHWGYSDEEIDMLDQSVRDDNFNAPVPNRMPQWNMRSDPNFNRFYRESAKTLTNEAERNYFWAIVRKDPVANLYLEDLLKEPFTSEDVKEFINWVHEMGIVKPLAASRPDSNIPKTALDKTSPKIAQTNPLGQKGKAN